MHRTRYDFLLTSSKNDESQAKLLELPATSGGEHLLSYLADLGYIEIGEVVKPIGWETIWAWKSALDLDLDTWEVRTLKELSDEYLKMFSMAKSNICPPPGGPSTTPDAQIGQKLRSIMDGFKKARGKKPKRLKAKK